MLKFSLRIEQLVANTDYTYLEAITEHCKETGLEIEVAATLIKLNANIKGKIQEEAEDLNFLPKIARLPIE